MTCVLSFMAALTLFPGIAELVVDASGPHAMILCATSIAIKWLIGLGIAAAVLVMIPLLLAAGFSLTVVVLVFVLPIEWSRAIGWNLLKLCYRFRVHGAERFPTAGGAVVVANHVSYLDGILMLLVCPRRTRTIVYAGNFTSNLMQRAARRWGAILISAGPKSIVRALKTAREAVENGDVVGIFPEGGITRSGMLQGFKPGLLQVIKDPTVPIVPIYFDGLWGSIFSFEGRRFFWKIPRRYRYPIDIYFGEPLYAPESANEVRQTIQQLGAKAVNQRMQRGTELPESVIRACKQRKFSMKVADSAGVEMTGGQVLMRALILRRLLKRHCLAPDEVNVGVLLPPSAGGVLTNLALAFDRRVAINLNYTVSSDIMNECLRLAGIKHVLTSRKVMEKLNLDFNAEVVCLEDLREHVKLGDKLAGVLGAYVTPSSILAKQLGLQKNQPGDVLTVIFTSGSTGIPKGVMLTHANVRSNVDAVDQVIHLQHSDAIVGILPFFHSFGYTITLWAVMALDIQGLYHFNPLDARQVGKLIQRHRGTILLSTPTFLRSYLKRCSCEELQTLDTIVTGAERLPKELADAFEKKFGVRPVEGYGTTELSPLVSVNIPPSRSSDEHQVDLKEGTVGRCVPGVAAKVVDADGNEQPTGTPGMLLVSGPNVMKGYMNQPDKTAEVIRDGWYVTGDVAQLDDDGFITITGRESRFSKIGGEMVPHLRVEELLQELVAGNEEEEAELKLAVTSVPDPKKGERLVVVHTSLNKSPDELTAALKLKGLPNIFIPSVDSFIQVDEIPVLGTGKLDLRQLKEVAEKAFQRCTDDLG